MTEDQFRDLIARGRELRGIEFKASGSRTDRAFLAKVARAVIGLSNIRDGGLLVLGVEESGGALKANGVTAPDRASWDPDSTGDSLARCMDPPADFTVLQETHMGTDFVVLEVREFRDVPLICTRDYEGTLREGACYVRTRRKPETAEIPTHAEMREVLDLAIEKGVRRFVAQAVAAGLRLGDTVALAPSSPELYSTELGDLA